MYDKQRETIEGWESEGTGKKAITKDQFEYRISILRSESESVIAEKFGNDLANCADPQQCIEMAHHYYRVLSKVDYEAKKVTNYYNCDSDSTSFMTQFLNNIEIDKIS